jgi:hypothetical protein
VVPLNNERHLPFAEAVSLEGWLSAIENGRATVHVDATFGTQRIGAEEHIPVRFTLSLRKAEVIVLIGAEPLTVDRASVARDSDPSTVKRFVSEERSKTENTSAETELALGLTLEAGGLKPSAGAKASRKSRGGKAHTVKAGVEIHQQAGLIRSIQGQTADGDYKWALMPRAGTTLNDKPWDAVKVPRFAVTVGGSYRAMIDPPVRVEVRCLYEDLHIEKLTVKNEGIAEMLQAKFGHANRMAAAEAYIRHKIFNDGRATPLDPYTSMVFARVVCTKDE